MKLLIDIKDFDNYKSRDNIPLECKVCQSTFYREKHFIQAMVRGCADRTFDFCSKKCQNESQKTLQDCICKQCNIPFTKKPSQIKKTKNNFCSHSCAAFYTNSHKTTGTKRAKLEKWLEQTLPTLYPDLEIIYNDTSAIEAELDIYIPELKLAFELNGPFHYEPIYGLEKLTKTQKNDKRKILTCAEKGIELCVIDTSHQKYFKESTSIQFLNIIKNVINSKLVDSFGTAPKSHRLKGESLSN